MSHCRYIAANPDTLVLAAAPIARDWVLAGAPQARSVEVSRSPDGASNTMIWDCTAGTFRWYFGVDETVHIIEGEVIVSDDNGNRKTLRAGDIGFFPAGTWMTWRVDAYVRKVAFLRHPLPAPFGGLLRALNFGLNMVRLRLHRMATRPSAS